MLVENIIINKECIKQQKSSVHSCRAIASSPDFSLSFRSKLQCRGQKIGSFNILAYILVYFSNLDPEKAFSRCRVVRVSKLWFSFICEISHLKCK